MMKTLALLMAGLLPLYQYSSYTHGISHGNSVTIISASYNEQLATTNWSSCGSTACAGGAGNTSGIAQAINVSSPSISGHSMSLTAVFPASGNNVLFVDKPGIADNATWIEYELDVWPSSSTANWEFDSLIINTTNNVDAMFGKQCNAVTGYWQYANQTSIWTNGPIPCTLVAGTHYHLIFYDYYNPLDTSGPGGLPYLHYGYISINGVTSSWAGTQIVATVVPGGWTHAYGCQVQFDSNAAATAVEYIDNFNCVVGR